MVVVSERATEADDRGGLLHQNEEPWYKWFDAKCKNPKYNCFVVWRFYQIGYRFYIVADNRLELTWKWREDDTEEGVAAHQGVGPQAGRGLSEGLGSNAQAQDVGDTQSRQDGVVGHDGSSRVESE